jgi:hypothetical protein
MPQAYQKYPPGFCKCGKSLAANGACYSCHPLTQSIEITVNGKKLPSEQTFEELKALCGEVIATLRVNFDRGSLTTADQTQFLTLLAAWERRISEIK